MEQNNQDQTQNAGAATTRELHIAGQRINVDRSATREEIVEGLLPSFPTLNVNSLMEDADGNYVVVDSVKEKG